MMLLLTTVAAAVSMAQATKTYDSYRKSSYSDPAIENFRISDAEDNATLNTDLIDMGKTVKAQFTLLNEDAQQMIPAGSCRIVISLGSKFTVATDLQDAAKLPLSQYFKWSAKPAPGSGQYIITGILYNDLPAKFSGRVAFKLMPLKVGTSTAVCQLQITNERNTRVLSDMNPNNNYASLSYTNVKPLDIKFIRFSSVARGCLLDLTWAIYDEDKAADKLVIETAADGINFTPVQTIPASGGAAYGYMLDKLAASNLTVRIKAATDNGQYVYSEKIVNSNNCKPGFEAAIYPNPIAHEATEALVVAKAGIFNGRYSIKVTTASGTEVRRMDATYNNQVQVKVKTGLLAAGMYFVTLTGEDEKPISLKMVKE